jgi:hypothetical protein
MAKRTSTRTGYMIVDAPGPYHITYWGGGDNEEWVSSADKAHAYTTAAAAREVIKANFAHIYSVSVQPVDVTESTEDAPESAS